MAGGFGAFGKMPTVGDFFRTGTPAGFVSAWDGWVQTGMLDCQEALGPAWDEAFLTAPIWRFCLAPGLAGPQGVLGVLMPSVDRVGRRFPLTLMAPLPDGADPLLAHFRNGALFALLEDLALAALDDLPKAELEERLASLPTVSAELPRLVAVGQTRALTVSGGEVGGALAAALLEGQRQAPSLWTSELGEERRLILCDGLPSGREFRALMALDAPLWTGGD